MVGYGLISPWKYRVSGWKPLRKVNAGDQLVFQWTFEHDVWRFLSKAAYDSCDFSQAEVLIPSAKFGRYKYTVKATQSGTMLYFGCSVKDHCARLMKAKVPIA